MKKILVTGSEGYIGQHLCKMLSETTDHDVYRLDKKINFDIVYDLEDYLFSFNDMPWQYDTIIHLAALVRVGESVSKPTQYYTTNVQGTINLLNSVECKNFIFASTGAAASPDSPYGFSKRIAEDIVKEICKSNNSNYTIFRFYNVIGTDDYAPTNPDGLFYNLIESTKTGKFTVYGNDYNTSDGTCIREYVHVNDICKAIIKAVDNSSNNIENLAYGDTKTVGEIIDIFKQTNEVDFDVVYDGKRPGDLEACYLENPSKYMERNYTYYDMLRM
jgi:UDP-glucose 4-epimerase